MSPALHSEEGTQLSPRLVACLAVVDRSECRSRSTSCTPRDEALLYLREKLAEQPSAIPYVSQEAHKGYLFTRCRWKKSDGERFSQVLNGRFKTK